ncbi:hypothetical protein ACKAV7_011221 [Fusarium commune]
MLSSSREGFVWVENTFELQQRWDNEPIIDDIKAVCQATLQLDDPAQCAVSFLTSGGFNKIYVTAGEVATLKWLSQHSTRPVPRVIAFDDTRDSKIGFEWILMEHVASTSARTRWRKMTMEDKKALVEDLARHHVQLLDTSSFQTIGTLKETNSDFIPDTLVSMMFFWGDHFGFDVHHGPFRSSHSWLYSLNSIMIKAKVLEMDKAVRKGDKDVADEVTYSLRIAKELSLLLPEMFSPDEDAHGKKECVSITPLWVATEVPKFLQGATREEKPHRDTYGDETAHDIAEKGEGNIDNEGKNELYWEHRMEYEQTQLRKVYSEAISQHYPQWDKLVAESTLKVGFLGTVARCADGVFLKGIEKWVDAVGEGEHPRLEEVLQS